MKFGISMNMTWHGASPMDVARTAESLGFESMWMGEHIFIPAEVRDPKLHVVSAVPPEYRHMADPFIWLTAAAVATTKIRLGFNICLVPQRLRSSSPSSSPRSTRSRVGASRSARGPAGSRRRPR